jgi:hypothetical protein
VNNIDIKIAKLDQIFQSVLIVTRKYNVLNSNFFNLQKTNTFSRLEVENHLQNQSSG